MKTIKFTPEELTDLRNSVNYHITGKRIWMKDNYLNLDGRYIDILYNELEDLGNLQNKLGPHE